MQASDVSSTPQHPRSDFVLHVGSLSSMSALHKAIADRLFEYNQLYVAGHRPQIRFDMTGIQSKKISMAALTALLTTMDRFREFSNAPAGLDVRWNPEIFGFLDDIGFFKLGHERDLFTLDPEIMGGYTANTTNPNTQLLYSAFADAWSTDQDELAQQKDAIRNQIKETLLMLCGGVFRPRRGARAIPNELRDQILVTSAELVVNAHLWGRSNAFLGLQRTSRGITVCVCDSGEGFLGSLRKKQKRKSWPNLSNHLQSLALGCVVNDEDFGLRRAIDMVTRFEGRVEISSYTGEIVWRRELWNYWLTVATDPSRSHLSFEEKFSQMWEKFSTQIGSQNKHQSGYCRVWTTPLRGSRVTFEMPIQDM